MKANFETGLKICSKCRRELPLSSFYKRENYNDGLDLQCVECRRERQRIVNATTKHRENQKRYQQSKKGKLQTKAANKRFLEYKRNWVKTKRESDIEFKIATNLRTRFNHMISDYHLYKWNSTFIYLGCTVDAFVDYFEDLFQKGMTWENYGQWHIDHIIPLTYFDLTKEENLYIAWNYRNLQPLWGGENCSKAGKIPYDVEERISKIKEYVNS